MSKLTNKQSALMKQFRKNSDAFKYIIKKRLPDKLDEVPKEGDKELSDALSKKIDLGSAKKPRKELTAKEEEEMVKLRREGKLEMQGSDDIFDDIEKLEEQVGADDPIVQLKKHKKKSEKTIIKTSGQVEKDFLFKQRVDIAKELDKFESRWKNNNVKVGNVFASRYSQLKQSLNFREAGEHYKNKYFTQYVTKFGLHGLAQQGLKCLLENDDIIPPEFKKNLMEKHEELHNFIAKTDVAYQAGASFADEIMGISEEIYDTSKTIRKQFLDYKSKREKLNKKDIANINRVRGNRAKKQLFDVLLPHITSKIADGLEAILANDLCAKADSQNREILDYIDSEILAKGLEDQFGLGLSEKPNFVSMISDISSFLTPLEMCRLLNGKSMEETLDRVQFFISVFYKKNYNYLDSRQKIANFFLMIGTLLDPQICIEIEMNSIPVDKCLDPDAPLSRFQRCLNRKNLEEIDELRRQFILTKKARFEKLVRLSFMPSDLELGDFPGQSSAHNKSKAEREQLEEYMDKYKESLQEMLKEAPRHYTKTVESVERVGGASGQMPSQVKDLIDKLPPSRRQEIGREITSKLKKSPSVMVPRKEKYIFPGLAKSLFLAKNELTLAEDGNSMRIAKEYDTSKYAKRKMAKFYNLLSRTPFLNFDSRNVIDLFEFSSPSYEDMNTLFLEIDGNNLSSTYFSKFTEKQHYYGSMRSLTIGEDKWEDYEERLRTIEEAIANALSDKEKTRLENIRDGKDGKGGLLADKAAQDKKMMEKIIEGVDFLQGLTPDRVLEVLETGQKINYKEKNATKSFYDFFKNKYILPSITNPKESQLIFPTGVTKPPESSLKNEMRTTYNQLVNICLNSVFAKKVPFGLTTGRNDNGKISGFELINLSPDTPGACAKVDLNMIPLDRLSSQLSTIDFKDYKKYFVDESAEKKRYLSFLLNFKSHVVDFILKSIFLFSEFSLEEKDIDDLMVDYVYIDMFQKIFEKDTNEGKDHPEFKKLTSEEQDLFFEKIRINLDLGKDKIEVIEGLIEGKKKESEKIRKRMERQFERDIQKEIEEKHKELLEDKETLIANIMKYLNKKCRFKGDPYTRIVSDEKIGHDPKYKKEVQQSVWDHTAFDPKTKKNTGAVRTLEFLSIYLSPVILFDQWVPRFGKNQVRYCDTVKDGDIKIFRSRYNGKKEEIKKLLEGKLQKESRKNIKVFKKEIAKFQSEVNFLENIIERLKLRHADVSYEITNVLLHYYNSQFPDNKTKDFCEAIRSLIRMEISEVSKQLKDLVYTKQKKDEKIFDLQDRFIEKKLNLKYIPIGSFEEKIPEFMKSFAKNTQFDHPFYEDGPFNIGNDIPGQEEWNIKEKIGNNLANINKRVSEYKDGTFDNFQRDYIYSQLGEDFFFMTDVQKLNWDSKSVTVSVYIGDAKYSKKVSKKDIESLGMGRIEVTELIPYKSGWDYHIKDLPLTYVDRSQDDVKQKELDDLMDNFIIVNPIVNYEALEISNDPVMLRLLTPNQRLMLIKGLYFLKTFVIEEHAAVRIFQSARTQREFHWLWEKSSNGVKIEDISDTNGEFSDAKDRSTMKKEWHIKKRADDDKKISYVVGNNLNFYLSSAQSPTRDGCSSETEGNSDCATFNIVYKKDPVIEFTIEIPELENFKKNYFKENKDKVALNLKEKKKILERYFHSCLKHQIIEKIKKEHGDLYHLYGNIFPLKKFLAHIAINMNKYSRFVSNIENEFGQPVKRNVNIASKLSDFSTFNINALGGFLASAGALTVVSAASLAKTRKKNKNMSALQIAATTTTFDFSVYFIKSLIKNYMSIIEQSELNLSVSKLQAEAVSAGFLAIYSRLKRIEGASKALAGAFGIEDPGQGFSLPEENSDIKYLFKPYVSPFAAINVAWIPPVNLGAWITYIGLEILLLSIEIVEDFELLDLLKDWLFSEDDPDSFNAVQGVFLEKWAKLLDEVKKANPITGSDLFTKGEEYMLPDGRDYVGEYHSYKDGTAIVGPTRPKNANTAIVLEKIVK